VAMLNVDKSLDFNGEVGKSKRVMWLKEAYRQRMPQKISIETAKQEMMEALPDLSLVRKSITFLAKEDRDKVREDVMKTVVAL
jgi:acyl-[acyl carrier protein]--UDP-N-acetylglucosamine O-acyltransferase